MEVFIIFDCKETKCTHLYELVFDDEDEHIITTGAVVTLTVHLQRENMSILFNKDYSSTTSTTINSVDYEANDDQPDDKENREKVFCFNEINVFSLFLVFTSS